MFVENKMSLDTEIINCEKTVDNNYIITLKESCFFCKGGGQPSDIGFINNEEVLKVYEENEIVKHIVKNPISGKATVKIDELFRKNNTILHTSQHLVSYVFDKISAYTSSFHIEKDHFCIDLSKILTTEELDEQENIINDLIVKGEKVIIRRYDEYKDKNLILKKDIDLDKLRIVSIFDIANPCCGTHLNNINEIKYIKIIKSKIEKEKTRIWVAAGTVARKYVQKSYNTYKEILKCTPGNEDNCIEFLQNKLKENKQLKKQINIYEKNKAND